MLIQKPSIKQQRASNADVEAVHGHKGQIVLQDIQMFIDYQQGQIVITVVIGQHLRSKCQVAFHSLAFRGCYSRCGRERERVETAGQGSIDASRTAETGSVARPGGLGTATARSHQPR